MFNLKNKGSNSDKSKEYTKKDTKQNGREKSKSLRIPSTERDVANTGNADTKSSAENTQVKKASKKSDREIKPKKLYTDDEIKKLLLGYTSIDSSKWSDIPLDSHIRYFKKDGTFVRGGFVVNHWFNKDKKPFIHLANNIKKGGKGYITWPVAHESVSKIYKKIETNASSSNSVELDTVKMKTSEIVNQLNKMTDIIKRQQAKIDTHEADLKKIKSVLQMR